MSKTSEHERYDPHTICMCINIKSQNDGSDLVLVHHTPLAQHALTDPVRWSSALQYDRYDLDKI